MIATLTSQNQITIPAEVRKRVGLKPGDRLAFVPEGIGGTKYFMEKIGSFKSLAGSLGKFTKRRSLPTKEEIAKAWTADYMRKYGKNGR